MYSTRIKVYFTNSNLFVEWSSSLNKEEARGFIRGLLIDDRDILDVDGVDVIIYKKTISFIEFRSLL